MNHTRKKLIEQNNNRSLLWGVFYIRGGFLGVLEMSWATIGINVLSLALPLTLLQVYDRIIGHQAIATLTWLVIGCLAAFAIEALLRYARSMTSQWIGAVFEHTMGCATVEKILYSDIKDYEKQEAGYYLERMKTIQTLRNFYGGQVFQVLMDLPFVLLFIYVIWVLGGAVVLVPLILVTSFAFSVLIIKIGFGKARQEQEEMNERRFNFLFEILESMHLIKSLTLEEQMLRRYERLLGNAANVDHQVFKWGVLPMNIGSLLSQVTMYSIILYGAKFVITGEMTLGELTACTILGGRALQPIQNISSLWLHLSDASIAQKRLQNILDLKDEEGTENPPFPNNIQGSITLQGIRIKDESRKGDYLLENLDLYIPPKELMILQSSNVNLTTHILLLINGMFKPDEGYILIDDYYIHEWDLSELRGCIEYVPQEGILFIGTILDNITMFSPQKKALALEISGLLGLDVMIADLPQGYATEVKGQSSNAFPSGLIQRICFARALMYRPRVLLIDRASSAMDQDSIEVLHDLLGRLKGHCTIVFVTQHFQLFDLADQVISLEKGSVEYRENITNLI